MREHQELVKNDELESGGNVSNSIVRNREKQDWNDKNGTDLDEIKEMLQQRNDKLQQCQQNESSSLSKSKKHNQSNSKHTFKNIDFQFPCFTLNLFEEERSDDEVDGDIDDFDEKDDTWRDDKDVGKKKKHSSITSKMTYHEKKLYREYLKQQPTGNLQSSNNTSNTNKQKSVKDDSKGDAADDDYYEETRNKAIRDFEEFSRKIYKIPNQLIRTQFNLKVLWPSRNPEYLPICSSVDMITGKGKNYNKEVKTLNEETCGKIKIPCCEFCKEERVPELQILSSVIYKLQVDKHLDCVQKWRLLNDNSKNIKNDKAINKSVGDGLDFGTVVMYVCSKNCGLDRFQKEFVFVQPGL